MRRRGIWIASVIVILGFERLAGFAAPALRHYWVVPLPHLPSAPSAYQTLADLRPVTFTMTVNWSKIRVTSTAEQLTSNPMFWRNMHFDDWDRLPFEIRALALGRMMERHRRAAAGPSEWSELDAADWDMVPQPLRAVLFPEMIEHWADTYGLTRIYYLDPDRVLATLNAVMMAESWFEHRGINVNKWGNRDLGLGGCSDRCRRILGEMAAAGDLDFALTDDDFFNPWHATRALVVWFGLELIRAEGEIALAVRAYHRGFDAASSGEGVEYLANVERLRLRYFDAQNQSQTWRSLRAWAAESTAPALPPEGRGILTDLQTVPAASKPDYGSQGAEKRRAGAPGRRDQGLHQAFLSGRSD